jgi:hypothetical protein
MANHHSSWTQTGVDYSDLELFLIKRRAVNTIARVARNDFPLVKTAISW